MTIEEIRELIDLVTETGVAELEVQRGENRVRISRGFTGSAQHFVVPAHMAPMTAPFAAAPDSNPSSATAAAAPGKEEEIPEPEFDTSLVMVKSPIVGTFYEAPSPGVPPFVQVGDTVHPGQVLCIIESMKLMNEIEAEFSGVVVKKLITNAQPVEYGEALFAVKPS